jgi:putative spermidine/putrescine transport system ATP-binding protein
MSTEPAGAGAYLHIDHLSKAYGNDFAVQDLSLDAARGELISLLGPSGCGKTTTLRMIAGFLHPDSGEIYIDGKPTTSVPSHKRETAIVFQNYALFPHMSVADNVGFGLKMRRVPSAQRLARVEQALNLVRLPTAAYRRFPAELSGGQQQRVALARALVVEPKLLLLDEPLSNLDARLRSQLRQELREIHDRIGTTTVFVTHDLEEAFELSDRVAVMNNGVIEQVASPSHLYMNPATPFVADFVGHVNVFLGSAKESPQGPVFTANDTGFDMLLPAHAPLDTLAVVVPEQRVRVLSQALKTDNVVEALVVRSSYRGRTTHLILEDCATHHRLETHATGSEGGEIATGSTVHVGWNRDDILLIGHPS